MYAVFEDESITSPSVFNSQKDGPQPFAISLCSICRVYPLILSTPDQDSQNVIALRPEEEQRVVLFDARSVDFFTPNFMIAEAGFEQSTPEIDPERSLIQVFRRIKIKCDAVW